MVVFAVTLGCWSQSEAGDGTSAKLMRDLAPEGADEGKPQIAPAAHLAIGAFGVLDPEERKDLAEAAKETIYLSPAESG
jgi:hypothetical protein